MSNALTRSEPPKPIPNYKRLTRAEIALILKASDDGLTQTAIAALIGCSQPTVSQTLIDFADTRLTARKTVFTRAHDVATATIDGSIKAAKDGKPEAGLELLDRLDVLPKRQVESNKLGIQINIGMPGQATGPEPSLLVRTEQQEKE